MYELVVSSIMPSVFMERKVRVFSRDSSTEKVNEVADAFKEYQRRHYGDVPKEVHATPLKAPRKRRRSAGYPADTTVLDPQESLAASKNLF
ncbi:hypothetical protein CYMTET_46257 [Cymbomonas tetramitiformis]|uniref:Uncharacterized protein n=1 Tax=Cymbomonas tetramitiformis TaxID=36881 RepID=A0AAE0EYV7_9CHLO|nr:hypothetical protein CYMTET_46257 [Cymbomonas tetramitiformis]KAK3244120.1 hypothetical protein CYMTET_46257 [Cymbomonas tetramitiformis]